MTHFNKGKTPANKGKTYPAESLTKSEIKALLKAGLEETSYCGTRAYAMVVTMLRTGMRHLECCNLRPIDIDREGCTIRILRPKAKKKPRVLGMGPATAEAIDRWLVERARVHPNADDYDPLFLSYEGGRVQTSRLREKLPVWAHRAKIRKRVHPHILRHTYSYRFMRDMDDLLLLQKMLGHSTVGMTMQYVDHLMPAEVVRVMQERG